MGGTATCWLSGFLRSSIGKKSLMAVTGLMLLAFVIGHLAGNLQIFIPDGGKKLNEYAEFLKKTPLVLWGTRFAMLVAVLVHIGVAVKLTAENHAARPVKYAGRTWREADYASRTMMWSGPIIAAFVVYHLLHYTVGSVHPKFDVHDVYRNVVIGFSVPWVSCAYIVAMLLLGLHLYHGFWSMFQTFGVNHPKYTPMLRSASAFLAGGIAAGYISIPVAVLMGLVK